MNALEMALEALTNPSTIAVSHAIELIRAELAKPLQEPPKREWVGLTDDEIEKIVDLNTSDDGGFDIWCDGIAVAHIVCAKLKEKNA